LNDDVAGEDLRRPGARCRSRRGRSAPKRGPFGECGGTPKRSRGGTFPPASKRQKKWESQAWQAGRVETIPRPGQRQQFLPQEGIEFLDFLIFNQCSQLNRGEPPLDRPSLLRSRLNSATSAPGKRRCG